MVGVKYVPERRELAQKLGIADVVGPKQLTLYGSWVCSLPQMEELVEHLVRWGLHPDVMVTHRFTLDQAKEAYELFDTGKTGKVALVWE